MGCISFSLASIRGMVSSRSKMRTTLSLFETKAFNFWVKSSGKIQAASHFPSFTRFSASNTVSGSKNLISRLSFVISEITFWVCGSFLFLFMQRIRTGEGVNGCPGDIQSLTPPADAEQVESPSLRHKKRIPYKGVLFLL